jgi:hypothetical protein
VIVTAILPTTTSLASKWTAGATPAANSGQAQSTTAPPATASLTAACLNSTTETAVVTWSAVADATSYQVVQATTSGGTYTASPTQPAGAVTTVNIVYTTGTTLYFKLYALIGTNWKGTLSANAKVVSTSPGFLVFATSGTRCTNN